MENCGLGDVKGGLTPIIFFNRYPIISTPRLQVIKSVCLFIFMDMIFIF